MTRDDSLYRPCVGIMLLNKDGLVFAARRIDTRAEAWQMPQGGIDHGETPNQAVMRELMEEIGTDKIEIISESKGWLYYDLPDYLAKKLWRGRYKGQKQKWFAMRYLGQDSDINIKTKRPEFCEWKWVPRETLPDIIVDFKRELYRSVLKEFEGI